MYTHVHIRDQSLVNHDMALVDHNIQAGDRTVNHSRDIHILSSAFLFIFLAYGAAQNLQTTLNTVSTFSLLCVQFTQRMFSKFLF